jgi:hypothetical protein
MRAVAVALETFSDSETAHFNHQFRYRRIMCVMTLDGTDTVVLKHAETMAQCCAAELVLLHVLPQVSELAR